jgi:hypothetical protein
MANIRIKDIATTASTAASDDFLALDGVTNGTRKLNAQRLTRTIAGTAGQVTVTNGDGVSGDPTISLPTALTGVNSLTSAAASNLTLGTGTFGTVLTFTSATGAATFGGNLTALGSTASIGTSFTPTAWGSGGAVDVNGSGGGLFAAYFNGSPRGYLVANTADLALNTQGVIPLLFRTNGSTRMTITSGGDVSFSSNTASTSTTTGALTVAGGLGVNGTLTAARNASLENYNLRGQAVIAGSSTGTLTTLANSSVNQVYLLTVRQSGAASNNAIAMVFAYGASGGVTRIAQDNTNPALTLDLSFSGLALRLSPGSGYGSTTWDWTLSIIVSTAP